MKLILCFLALSITIFPTTAFSQDAGDAWDPSDNSVADAVELPSPAISESTHGPHILSASDPYDWFKVALQKNVVYEFYASGGADTAAELFTEEGMTQIAANDDNGPGVNFRLRCRPDISGFYYLRIHLYSPLQEEAYTLHYLVRSGLTVPGDSWDPGDDNSSGAVVLELSASEVQHGPHTLSDSDREDWFAFQLQANQTYAFRSVGNSDLLGELYDGDGAKRLAADDDGGGDGNFQIVFTAPQSGAFLLRVRMFEQGFIGEYTLNVKSGAQPSPLGDTWDPNDDLFDGAADLGSPTKLTKSHGVHTLSSTDRFDWFQFTLAAGAQYKFYSTGDSDTLADLFQSDGVTLLSEDDNSGSQKNFSLIFSPKENGQYFLRVRSFQDQNASYQLNYVLLQDAQSQSDDFWDPVDNDFQGATNLVAPADQMFTHGPHSLSLADQSDWFVFTLTAGIEYEFWTSGESDTVGELMQSNGTTGATQQDEGGSAYNFRIQFTPATSGAYYLRVRLFDPGSRGVYTLHYNRVNPIPAGADSWDLSDDEPTGATNLGIVSPLEQQHGPHTISNADRADWFTFTLAVGAVYDMYTTGESDTAAILYYADGITPVIQQDEGGAENNFRITFSPAIAGVYYLKVYELLGGEAAYTLHVYGGAAPLGNLQPYPVFNLLSQDEFIEIPGGYSGLPAGKVSLGNLPANLNEITDGKGATLTAAPGQVVLLQFPAIDASKQTLLLRALVGSNGAGAAVALAALDGSLDGSIATNIPANSALFQNQYQWMTLIFHPISQTAIPVVQLANIGGKQTVSLYLDTLEVYYLPQDETISAAWIQPNLAVDTPDSFPPLPYASYNLASASEFIEQPGGFTNAQPGAVTIGKISQTTNEFSDGIGACLTVSQKEVEMLLFPTLKVEDDLILIRARIRTSGGGASIALAALDGSLDGSIATRQFSDSSQFTGDYQWISLTYNSPGTTVAPLIQFAGGSSENPVSLYLDTVEIYRYTQGSRIANRLLYSE